MRIGIVGIALASAFGCSYSAPGTAATGDGNDGPTSDGAQDSLLDAFVCPSGYAPLTGAPAGSLYRVSGGPNGTGNTGRSNWVDAQLDCGNDGVGTHLAIPETEEEYQALSDAVSGATRWLGVTDRITEATWIPIIGGTTFVGHWFGNTPEQGDSGAANNDCMTLCASTRTGPLGTIHIAEAMPCADTDADDARGYICECDGRAVDPATF